MDTGTHNPQAREFVSTCRIDDGVEGLVITHTHQKPTGDGRHWLLLNLPERSSCTLYFGANQDAVNEIHAAVLKAAAEAIRYERARCLQIVRELARAKVVQARNDQAPASYMAAIEATADEITIVIQDRMEVLHG